MLRPLANPWLLLALPVLAACGSSSGPVLERVKEVEPPDSNLRADVFLARDVQSCAIGEACRSADPDLCFTLSDASGPRLAFRPETVEFVPPDSPEIALAAQSACFRLTMDDAQRDAIVAEFAELRQQAFQLSAGEINLTVKLHELGLIDAGFKRWEGRTGIFLQPEALEAAGLSLITRETDFVFGVTGSADPGASLIPKIDACAGTNWLDKGGFGGSSYTWVSPQCANAGELLWHFVAQSYFALRDVTGFADLYRGNYPQCGSGSADPRQWFPALGDCRSDPDSPSCGLANCNTGGRFVSHILSTHWPRVDLIGNHCRNNTLDFDELDVDSGGICDELGR